jgi:hypothetical protein
MIITGESVSTGAVLFLRAARVNLETEEWIPPQRPLSEETTIKSLRLPGDSDGALAKISLHSCQYTRSANQPNQQTIVSLSILLPTLHGTLSL